MRVGTTGECPVHGYLVSRTLYCPYCKLSEQAELIGSLKSQLQHANRQADESAQDAHRRGWEEGMLRALDIAEDVEEGCGYGCPNIIADAIRKEANSGST